MSTSPLVIWRFRDGKPGHEQQSLGLVRAIQRLQPADVTDFDVRELQGGWWNWLFGRFPAGQHHAPPDLLIGAGHATHPGLLAARRVFGGQLIVLMKPSLPRFLFDLVIAPEHDGLPEAGNVICTRGVLNAMRPGAKRAGRVLLLLGGISRHGRWSDARVLAQVERVLAAAGPDFCISDSRRTPPELSQQLRARYGSGFQSWQDCPPGWLGEQLAVAETAWVSEDSASMVYEALGAGCRVGILPLEEGRRDSRVLAGLHRLAAEGRISYLDESAALPMAGALPVLQEADRVAALMQARGFLSARRNK